MKLINKLIQTRWALGFVRGGMNAVMEGDRLDVDWVKMPKDRWFADPFVLDVTEDEILVLVEDMAYTTPKGVISLLHINKTTFEISSRKVLLGKDYHLSFPAIERRGGHIYVYPEAAHGNRLDLYEYHPDTETLTYEKTICEDCIWDSVMTDCFGEQLLFTAAHDDRILDIYRWNENIDRYIPYKQIMSDTPNSRMGGAVFSYKGRYYYPAQDCSKSYGCGIDIKRLIDENGIWKVEAVKHIESLNKRYPIGLHTLNEYKDVVVIDVRGYRYGIFGAIVNRIVKLIKMNRNEE